MKIGMISLGCDKNRVDSEKMLALIAASGYEITDDIKAADAVIINTCAFIESAKKEAIENILSTAAYKADSLKFLIVTGCFAQRYGKVADFPEVDLFLDISEEKNIVSHLNKLFNEKPATTCADAGRIITTPAHYAYLKIAEGCDNRCTYCAIPYIRGKYRSAPVEDLVKEAENLLKDGIKELILVAQDTTNYGKDLYGKPSLTKLLQELVKLDFWKIRILYAYPELIDDNLLDFIANNDKIARYLDIPLQHADPLVLKKMNRRGSSDLPALVARIREKVPGISIRSTFICGFPYETEKEHAELLTFLKNGVDFGGFFAFSPEEDTPAYGWKNRANKRTAAKWVRECEAVQSEATVLSQRRFVGQTLDVIYEDIDYKTQTFVGRSEHNAPDVDTSVFFTADFPLEIGRVYKVKITNSDFNLYGEAVKE